MAVALDAAGTESTGNAQTTFDNTSLTVGAGTNRALIVLISKSTQAASTSVTWDQGGTNQACTLIIGVNGTGAVARAELWGLVAPTSGNKTLRWVGASSDVCVDLVAYTGVDQTGVTTSFPNSTSAQITQAGSTTQNNGVTVTSAVGNATLSCQASDQGTFNSTNNTQLYVDNAPANISAAGSRAAGAATVSMTANLTTGVGAAHIAIVGTDVLASGATAGNIAWVTA